MKANLNHLMVLEDNEQICAAMCRLGERNGYRATGVHSASEFKSSYLAERPSLIVMDMIIGDADCIPVLKFLADCRNQVPIVLMSGYNPSFFEMVCREGERLNQKIIERVEKRRTLFKLEDVLQRQRIPELDLDDASEPSAGGGQG